MINTILALKIIATFAIAVLVWISALSPLALSKFQSKPAFNTIISLANAFGGGVFLAVGLLHLLPDVVAGLHSTKVFFNMPIPFLLLLSGYMAILLFEKVLFAHHHGHGHGNEQTHSHSHNKNNSQPPIQHHKDFSQLHSLNAPPEVDIRLSNSSVTSAGSDDAYFYFNDHLERLRSRRVSRWGIFNKLFSKTVKEFDNEIPDSKSELKEPLLADEVTTHVKTMSWRKVIGPVIMAAVLTIHSFFEGLLLGIQMNRSSLIQLLFAVMSHKWVESLTIGLRLLRVKVKKRTFVVFVTVFALLNPLGIIVGIFISAYVDEAISTYFDAFACGSFLYIQPH